MSARNEYDQRIREIEQQLKAAEKIIKILKGRANKNGTHWGHVGDAGKALKEAKELTVTLSSMAEFMGEFEI